MMTVAQLKQCLDAFPDDAEIRIITDSGDFWKTKLACPIESVVWTDVQHSPYHNQDKVINRYEDPDPGGFQEIVGIS